MRRADEGGAVAVLVAVMMVVLLGMGAIVVDVGGLFQNRRELQNGADAAALAIAQDCGGKTLVACMALPGLQSTASTYAGANSATGTASASVGFELPGASLPADSPAVATSANSHCPSNATGCVTVRTSNPVSYGFARILPGQNHTGTTVHALSTVAWGTPTTVTSFPLGICEQQLAASLLEQGNFPLADPPPPGSIEPLPIVYKVTNQAGGCPGFTPGNLGWITPPSGHCTTPITLPPPTYQASYPGKPGTAVPQGCKLKLPATLPAVVILPVYDATSKSSSCSTGGSGGANCTYDVVDFVGIYLTGYRFPGTSLDPPCGPSDSCIQGYIVYDGVNDPTGSFNPNPPPLLPLGTGLYATDLVQ